MKLKSNSLKGKAYRKLVTRLFLQTVALLFVSGALVLFLREVVRGHLGDAIVETLMYWGGIDWDEAHTLYFFYVQNHRDLIIIALIVVLFFVLFRIFLSWFTRYFDEIVEGVDQLVEEKDESIVMSSELAFMEGKLNEVKQRLKTRQDEAKAAEQRKNDLVMYLAHDIRTPLTSVIGYLSLLDEGRDFPREQREKYIHIALEKACRLETLVNEFFEITRYRFQSVPLRKEKIDLCYMLVQMAEEMYPLRKEKGQEFAMNLPETVWISADPDQFARVLNNLLKNAVAYGCADSVISVTVSESDDGVSLVIANDGGIPPERLSAVFEKFYRLDDARSSATGGAGLGLAIAKDIVELHGGVISAESDGETTRFCVSLPKTEPDSLYLH
ncbi:MAG: sensor histidine kinase [Clostridia bacterium]